jgi:gamma-F420-2:alpha-L-glutamate ligase
MKGWILYHLSLAELTEKEYEMHRFLDAAKARGIELNIVRPEQLDLIVTQEDQKSIRLDGKITDLPDFVIPRQGAATTYFSLAIIRHLERLGVLILNTSDAIEAAKDKLYTHQILATTHFPLPKTMLVKFPFETDLVEKLIGLPVVIKAISGTDGSGIYLAENRESFEDVLTLVESTKSGANLILQEFIANSRGRDLRVIVVGGRPVACMLRQATDGSFKANITRGGEPRPYKMTSEIEMMAVEASRILNLDIAGVDLLFDTDHFKLCEVNSSPGFKGMERAYPDINIADTILQYVEMRLGVFRSANNPEELSLSDVTQMEPGSNS